MYEVDLEVQRAIIPRNLSKLMDYIMLYLEHKQPVFFPGIILSARGAGVYDVDKGTLRLQPIEKLYVVDGQHRLAAFQRLMETFQSLMHEPKTGGNTTKWKRSRKSCVCFMSFRCPS